jgi:hypothetical protein
MISSFAYRDDLNNDYDILNNNSSSIRSNNYSDNKDNNYTNNNSKNNGNYQYLAQSVLINIHERSDCNNNNECKVLINFTHDAIIYQSNQQIQLQNIINIL